jgi:hypothetical protein
MASEASSSQHAQDDTCRSNGRGSRCIDSEWARSKLYVLPDGSTVGYAAPGPPGNTLNPQANLSLSQSARARYKRQSADAISNLVKPTQELQNMSQHPSQKSHSPNLNPLEEYVQEMLSTPICPRYQTDGRYLRVGIDLVFGDNDVIIGSNQGLGLSSDHIQASIDHLNTQFIEDDLAKNSTRNEEHNTNIEYEIQRLKYKLIDDLHFVRESRSTSSELKNRAIFVTKYLAGYPTWVAYEFAGCERFGLPYGGLAKVYVDFMCSYITDPTLYKSIFEALLIEAGGITVNEAMYMPCFKYNDVFQYNHPRREDGKLMTSFKNFNLYFYLKKNNILILTELAGLSTLKNHLAETKEFLPMLKSIRRRLMNYISPDADMYTEMVVTLPQCNIKEEMTVYEIVNQCLYALLGFRKLGEMIDSSPYPARNVRAISAVITLQELKKYLKEI